MEHILEVIGISLEISWNIIGTISWNIMEYHGRSWSIMESGTMSDRQTRSNTCISQGSQQCQAILYRWSYENLTNKRGEPVAVNRTSNSSESNQQKMTMQLMIIIVQPGVNIPCHGQTPMSIPLPDSISRISQAQSCCFLTRILFSCL